MAAVNYKLICETPETREPLQLISEQSGIHDSKRLFVTGPYMGAGVVNKNNRLYPFEEMQREVDIFIKTKINEGIATGELNHPEHANLDLERACHKIVDMWESDGVWYGKSLVLEGTPTGNILKSLLQNEVRIGMSSRCLGQLDESNQGYSIVKNLKMITVDAVADPSFSDAWVNGILESKQFLCSYDENTVIEQKYNNFEKQLSNLSRTNSDKNIKNAIIDILQSFNK